MPQGSKKRAHFGGKNRAHLFRKAKNCALIDSVEKIENTHTTHTTKVTKQEEEAPTTMGFAPKAKAATLRLMPAAAAAAAAAAAKKKALPPTHSNTHASDIDSDDLVANMRSKKSNTFPFGLHIPSCSSVPCQSYDCSNDEHHCRACGAGTRTLDPCAFVQYLCLHHADC